MTDMYYRDENGVAWLTNEGHAYFENGCTIKLSKLAQRALKLMLTKDLKEEENKLWENTFPRSEGWWLPQDFVKNKECKCNQSKTSDLRNSLIQICDIEKRSRIDKLRKKENTITGIRLTEQEHKFPDIILTMWKYDLIHHFKKNTSYYERIIHAITSWLKNEKGKPSIRVQHAKIIYKQIENLSNLFEQLYNQNEISETNIKDMSLINEIMKSKFSLMIDLMDEEKIILKAKALMQLQIKTNMLEEVEKKEALKQNIKQ